MRRAFRSARPFAKGIDNSVFRLLDHIRKGNTARKISYDKQVEIIKKYLFKGIANVLKWQLHAEERLKVLYYHEKLHSAYDEDSLYSAIEGLLDATKRFKAC
jgi:hypothetical protein